MTKEQLIFETKVLATDYYFSVSTNDGIQILKVFSEYISLMQKEEMLDKQVVENALTIMAIYDRENSAIVGQ